MGVQFLCKGPWMLNDGRKHYTEDCGDRRAKESGGLLGRQGWGPSRWGGPPTPGLPPRTQASPPTALTQAQQCPTRPLSLTPHLCTVLSSFTDYQLNPKCFILEEYHPHLTDEKAEVQRGHVTCRRSHSYDMA